MQNAADELVCIYALTMGFCGFAPDCLISLNVTLTLNLIKEQIAGLAARHAWPNFPRLFVSGVPNKLTIWPFITFHQNIEETSNFGFY